MKHYHVIRGRVTENPPRPSELRVELGEYIEVAPCLYDGCEQWRAAAGSERGGLHYHVVHGERGSASPCNDEVVGDLRKALRRAHELLLALPEGNFWYVQALPCTCSAIERGRGHWAARLAKAAKFLRRKNESRLSVSGHSGAEATSGSGAR